MEEPAELEEEPEEGEEGEEGHLLPCDGEEVTQVNTAAEAAMEDEHTSEAASEGEAVTDEPKEKEKEMDNCEPLVDLSDVAAETMGDSGPAKPQSSETLVDLSDVVVEEPESAPAKPQSDYRLQFAPGEGGLVPVPEHALLPLVGPPPQGDLSSAASETVSSGIRLSLAPIHPDAIAVGFHTKKFTKFDT